MLQQNNNNNYPCLNGLDSTPEMLQKCSRTSLPFSRALELADLPLIRGLRAWALCSKNRRKAGGVLGGGQAPMASAAGHRSAGACPRPADVYLSREWGHMAYGLPFGPDAGQAGIRALVTVASLKTSEGSGKTQTQCLFLQTEKGSCLYSAGKPGSGGSSAAASVVGGWLKGKTGATGCRETPGRQRDQGSTPAAESAENHGRVRSGRRWRKSCNAASKEKKGVNRDGPERWRGDAAAESTRQEEPDNGGEDRKQVPSLQQLRRIRQEKEEELQGPICHDASPNSCEAQRDGPTGSSSNRQNSDSQPRQTEEEEQRVACVVGSSGSQAFSSDPDLETTRFHPESCSNAEITHTRMNAQRDGDSGEEGGNSEMIKALTNNCEQVRHMWENLVNQEKTEEGRKSLEVDEDKISTECFSVLVCNPSLYIRAELSPKHLPPGGSTSSNVPERLVLSGKQCLKECEHQIRRTQELQVYKFDQQEQNSAAVQDNTVKRSSEPLLLLSRNEGSSVGERRDVSSETLSEPDWTVAAPRCCSLRTTLGPGAQEETEDWPQEAREGPETAAEGGVVWRGGQGNDVKPSTVPDLGLKEDKATGVRENCPLQDNWRVLVSAEECRIQEETADTCGEASSNTAGAHSEISANVSHAASTDPSTSLTLSRPNPAHFLPLLESMTTDLPLVEVEEEERVRLLLRGQSQGGGSSHRRELEEPREEKRGFALASQSRDEGEEDEDEFGVFMQADGESAWSPGSTMPASVPCGSRESIGE